MSIRLNHNSAALRVCVDRAEQGRISGRVFGQRLVRPIVFTDIGDLLLQVEAVLDAQNFPQAFQRVRTFVPGKMEQQPPAALGVEDGIPAGEVAAAAGQVTTFLLSVVTRRNTTWQGYLEWLDSGERQEFESVLELLKLTDHHVFRQN